MNDNKNQTNARLDLARSLPFSAELSQHLSQEFQTLSQEKQASHLQEINLSALTEIDSNISTIFFASHGDKIYFISKAPSTEWVFGRQGENQVAVLDPAKFHDFSLQLGRVANICDVYTTGSELKDIWAVHNLEKQTMDMDSSAMPQVNRKSLIQNSNTISITEIGESLHLSCIKNAQGVKTASFDKTGYKKAVITTESGNQYTLQPRERYDSDPNRWYPQFLPESNNFRPLCITNQNTGKTLTLSPLQAFALSVKVGECLMLPKGGRSQAIVKIEVSV
jgi:hypothetical protein